MEVDTFTQPLTSFSTEVGVMTCPLRGDLKRIVYTVLLDFSTVTFVILKCLIACFSIWTLNEQEHKLSVDTFIINNKILLNLNWLKST